MISSYCVRSPLVTAVPRPWLELCGNSALPVLPKGHVATISQACFFTVGWFPP